LIKKLISPIASAYKEEARYTTKTRPGPEIEKVENEENRTPIFPSGVLLTGIYLFREVD